MGTRKMIQTTTFQRGNLWFIFTLCDDGSMWERNLTASGPWMRQDDIPQTQATMTQAERD